MFEDRYGRPGKENDKGKLEGMVGFARRTFMVPFPRAHDFADLNVMLKARCRERQGKTLRANTASTGLRMTADKAAFQDLPAVPFEACDKRPGRVTSQALVCYKGSCPVLRRSLEARLSPKNRRVVVKREYVQVLRLIEVFLLVTVHGVARDTLQPNAISYDTVKHLVLCQMEKRSPTYPHLAMTNVTTTSPFSYMSLLSGKPA